MLDRRSASATFKPVSSATISLGEVRSFSLTQAAGFSADVESTISAVTGPLPPRPDTAITSNGRVIFRTAPLQFWLIGPEQDDLAQRLAGTCIVTPLSHSRTRIFIEGVAARQVLAKGIALDFHHGAFTACITHRSSCIA
jgi:heterotetrameric sarcosine oxidase gamma subunit